MSTETPWFKMYASEWLADPALRRCSLPARGLWADMLCWMWNADEPGVLLTDGRVWTDDDLVRAAGGRKRDTRRALDDLYTHGVATKDERGAIISKSMIQAEKKRRFFMEAGKRGGSPTLKGGVNPPVNLETRDQRKRENQQPETRENRSVVTGLSVIQNRIMEKLVGIGMSRKRAALFSTHRKISEQMVDQTILAIKNQPGVDDVAAVVVTALREQLGDDIPF